MGHKPRLGVGGHVPPVPQWLRHCTESVSWFKTVTENYWFI